MDVAQVRHPKRQLFHRIMMRNLILLLMQGCSCDCLNRRQCQWDLLILLLLLLMLIVIAIVENRVDYLGDVVFDITVDLCTDRFEYREYRLPEDSRLLNGAANKLKRLLYSFCSNLICT